MNNLDNGKDFVKDNTMLTTAEVLQILRIGRTKFSSMVKSGELKGVKFGRTWRFSRDYIERIAKGEDMQK